MEYPDAELSVVFTDDDEIAELNLTYRSKQGATDVLSFSQREGECLGEDPEQILGDVVISVETAARQAGSTGHSLQQEVLRLLIHGVLHLLGYEHENVPEREAQQMFAKEEELYLQLAPLVCE